MMDGLTVGRIVHYRGLDYSERYEGDPVCQAAIVVAVDDAKRGAARLTIFDQAGNTNMLARVAYDNDAKPFDTWHWPERA